MKAWTNPSYFLLSASFSLAWVVLLLLLSLASGVISTISIIRLENAAKISTESKKTEKSAEVIAKPVVIFAVKKELMKSNEYTTKSMRTNEVNNF